MYYSKSIFVIMFGLLLSGCASPSPVPAARPTNTPIPAASPIPVSPTPVPTKSNTATPRPPRTSAPTPTLVFDYSHYDIDPELEKIAHDFPMVASSTSANPLWVKVICRIFNVYCPRKETEIWPEWSDKNHDELTGFILDHAHLNGTHEAYLALINGDADIILVARAPSQDELNDAQAKNVAFDVQPIALDAFVFLVNSQNTVDNLSLEQLRQIYSGKITNWKQVGGKDQEIHAYQREENSGSQELMTTLVMTGTPMINAQEMIAYTMAGPFNAIGAPPYLESPGEKGDVAGIGYSVYYYAKYMVTNDDVEFIGVDGIEPTSVTIRDRTYPLTTEVYAVVRKGLLPEDSAIQLRNWLLSPGGQLTIEYSGYVFLP
jgi:phosphate transport system substrate-binding protein